MEEYGVVKEHRCTACGGVLVFAPEKGKMVCESCGAEYEVQSVQQTGIGGFDFTEFYKDISAEGGENLPIYRCKSCGAEVIVTNEEASLTCPYCSSKIVLTEKISGNVRPDGIIPFKIPQKELKTHIDNFYKDKKLLPRNFFSASKMEKVTGVYVPFWFFSGKLDGEFHYTGKQISSTTQGDYIYTTTKNYAMRRDAHIGFSGIPIDASDKIDDSLMDSVLPYDMSELKPFQTDYLSGFTADRFDVPGKKLQERAEKLMKKTSSDIVENSFAGKYTQTVQKSASMNVSGVGVKYVLLPIYFFKIKYRKKSFTFAVNGQNGKVVGNLPTDKNVSRIYFLIRFGIVAGIIMGAEILSYLFGGPF